jgi:hypothetical protein
MDEKGNAPDELELARAVYSMRYGDLKRVAQNLYEMTALDEGPKYWPLDSEDNWAFLLFTWAESVVENHEAEG